MYSKRSRSSLLRTARLELLRGLGNATSRLTNHWKRRGMPLDEGTKPVMIDAEGRKRGEQTTIRDLGSPRSKL